MPLQSKKPQQNLVFAAFQAPSSSHAASHAFSKPRGVTFQQTLPTQTREGSQPFLVVNILNKIQFPRLEENKVTHAPTCPPPRGRTREQTTHGRRCHLPPRWTVLKAQSNPPGHLQGRERCVQNQLLYSQQKHVLMRVIRPPTHAFSLPFQQRSGFLGAFPSLFADISLTVEFFPISAPTSNPGAGWVSSETAAALAPALGPHSGVSRAPCSAPRQARAHGRHHHHTHPRPLCHSLARSLPSPRQITLPSSGVGFIKTHRPTATRTAEIQKENREHQNPAEQLPTELLPA